MQRGVTLIEMIVVLVITGILAAGVALFIRLPIEGYIDASRRAELSDRADMALRRINRDLRFALPNSVRVTGACSGVTTCYLEFLLTSGGGRYRAELTGGGAGDELKFTEADQTFDVYGTLPTLAAGDSVVVYNLFAEPTIGTSNAYAGDNRAAIDVGSSTATNIALTAMTLFPFASPSKRFHIVQTPVTYECNPVTQEFRRYSGYAIQHTPQPAPPAGGGALLMERVSTCRFTYDAAVVAQRAGIVSMRAQITQDGETVSLFQQTHVSNIP